MAQFDKIKGGRAYGYDHLERFRLRGSSQTVWRREVILDPDRESKVVGLLRRWQGFEHPNIIKLVHFEHPEPEVFFLYLEDVGERALADLLRPEGDPPIPEAKVKTIFGQLVSALKYLHAAKITHRAISLESVWLDASDNVKLVGFESSKEMLGQEEASMSAMVPYRDVRADERSGRPRVITSDEMFMSPELLEDEPFTYSTDIWSVAVVVLTLMCSANPFGPTPYRYAMGAARGTWVKEPVGYSESFVRVLRRMLDSDKYLRLSLGQILEIPWCSSIAQGRTAWSYVYWGIVAEKGIGQDLNRKQAMTNYRTGADRGEVIGMVLLADMLSNGERGERNLAEALTYYKKAADEGSAHAMHRAAIGYDEGWGGARNVSEARKYYEMAASHGVRSADADLERLRRT